jgi:hypothetical protein
MAWEPQWTALRLFQNAQKAAIWQEDESVDGMDLLKVRELRTVLKRSALKRSAIFEINPTASRASMATRNAIVHT